MEQKLVDNLVFLVGKKKLTIEVANIEDSRRANVFFAPNKVHVKVDPAELEGWVDFFLKYYRDGVAQVDHIDGEALAISEEPEDIYITFIVKDAVYKKKRCQACDFAILLSEQFSRLDLVKDDTSNSKAAPQD